MKSRILPSNICRENILNIKINVHLKSLRSLRWITLARVDVKDAVDLMKHEVIILRQLLARHHAKLPEEAPRPAAAAVGQAQGEGRAAGAAELRY